MPPLHWLTASVVKKGSSLSNVAFLLPSSSCAVAKRGITGKTMRNGPLPRKKPWPYEKKGVNYFDIIFDKTTHRFDENSKIIAIEGAHSVGKSKLARELAEEFEMLYMPPVDMDYFYKNDYGDDLRNYNHCLTPFNKTYDEKDFARDPLGPVYGCADRLFFAHWCLKCDQYMRALRHIFNTGQGVVLERSIYSDYALYQAAFNAGWIRDRHSKLFYEKSRRNFLWLMMRPNLIIYLDAPIDVVRKNIAAKGNEWDKNSPVWSNDVFLRDYYSIMKRDYLVNAKPQSEVLVYDWSEPSESELVVEDVERLNFEVFGAFEENQVDWRLYNEEVATEKRGLYTNKDDVNYLRLQFVDPQYYHAEQMYRMSGDNENLQDTMMLMKGNGYASGFNQDLGDGSPLFKFSAHEDTMRLRWGDLDKRKMPWTSPENTEKVRKSNEAFTLHDG